MALTCFADMNDKTGDEEKFSGVISVITQFIKQEVEKLQKQLKKGGRKHPIDVDNLLMAKPHRDLDKSSTYWPKLIMEKRGTKMTIKSEFKQKVDKKYVKSVAIDYEYQKCYVKALLRIDDVYIGSSNECIRFKVPKVNVERLIDTYESYMGSDLLSDSDEE